MSKNLENEYKQMVAGEVPDLWARIEKSLPEKEVHPAESTPAQTTPAQTTDKPEVKAGAKPEAKPKRKKPVIAVILPWAGALAAVAMIAVLVLPVILLTHSSKNASTQAETAKRLSFEVNGITDGFTAEAGAVPEAENAEPEATEDAEGRPEDRNDITADPREKTQGAKQDSKQHYSAPAGGESEGADIVYGRILEVYKDSDEVFVQISDDVDLLKDEDGNVSVEAFVLKVSDDSLVDADEGLYKIVAIEDGIILLEKLE